MVKVYELSRYDAMTLRINYLGQTVLATFKGGNSAKVRARLTTADPFVQAAVENDSRFGKLFNLVRRYEDVGSKKAQNALSDSNPKKITKVKSVNDALLYFTTTYGVSIAGDTDLKSLMEKYNVEFPNLKM